jgi:hypothetical protein
VYDYGISTQMIIVPAICSSLLELLLVMTRAIQIQFPFVEKRFLKAGSDTVLLAEYSGSAQPDLVNGTDKKGRSQPKLSIKTVETSTISPKTSK